MKTLASVHRDALTQNADGTYRRISVTLYDRSKGNYLFVATESNKGDGYEEFAIWQDPMAQFSVHFGHRSTPKAQRALTNVLGRLSDYTLRDVATLHELVRQELPGAFWGELHITPRDA
ncbi:MAG TPA: hypothetical protein VLG10_08095, partial [Methylomirabilota bacterium]|nr:hypothetical protein [Methylomirabilota bacterium]